MYKYLSNFINKDEIVYKINSGKIHGLEHRNIEEFNDIDILIIVDSLDSNYDVYTKLKLNGLQVIILDHHEFIDYPDDAILVSSAKNYPNKHLSGSGVTWKFCTYLDTIFKTNYAKDLIDLAACGILGDVCDVSEVSYENRYIVNCGLNNLVNDGIKAVVGSYTFNSQSVIWSLAPLVNAANRTGNNELAIDLFLCDDSKKIKKIYKALKEIKIDQDLAVSNANINIVERDKIVFALVKEREFAGLIANQIANKYSKPAIIFYESDINDDEFKGSIRGFGINNFKFIINSTNLAVCHGHENAAGISCLRKDVQKLIDVLSAKLQNVDFKIIQDVDLKIKYSDITEKLIKDLDKINKINGQNFKPIKVGITNLEVFNPTLMKSKHTKFNYYDLGLIKWNDTALYDSLLCEAGSFAMIDVVGELQLSFFAGKKQKQLIISDYNNITILPDFLHE